MNALTRSLLRRALKSHGPGIVLGDSTSASSPRAASLLTNPTQDLITDCAVAGQSTSGQLTVLGTISSSVRHAAKWVIIMTGLNDRSSSSDTSEDMITTYQAAIASIQGYCPSAKIICATYNPAFKFYDSLEGAEGAPAVANYKKEWLSLNEAIKGRGLRPITGVAGRATRHLHLLEDPDYPNGFNPDYEANPNDQHQNALGTAIISASWQYTLDYVCR